MHEHATLSVHQLIAKKNVHEFAEEEEEKTALHVNNVCVLVRLRSITSAYLSLLGNCVSVSGFGELDGAHTRRVKWCDVKAVTNISNCCVCVCV